MIGIGRENGADNGFDHYPGKDDYQKSDYSMGECLFGFIELSLIATRRYCHQSGKGNNDDGDGGGDGDQGSG